MWLVLVRSICNFCSMLNQCLVVAFVKEDKKVSLWIIFNFEI